MTKRLSIIIGVAIVLGLIAVALSHAASSNVFEPAGCVYNADRREWVCPSPGRGSIQAPGDGPAGDSSSGASSGSSK